MRRCACSGDLAPSSQERGSRRSRRQPGGLALGLDIVEEAHDGLAHRLPERALVEHEGLDHGQRRACPRGHARPPGSQGRGAHGRSRARPGTCPSRGRGWDPPPARGRASGRAGRRSEAALFDMHRPGRPSATARRARPSASRRTDASRRRPTSSPSWPAQPTPAADDARSASRMPGHRAAVEPGGGVPARLSGVRWRRAAPRPPGVVGDGRRW